MAVGGTIRHTRDGQVWMNPRDLQGRWLDHPSPELEQTRRYFGRSLTPETIETVLRRADLGYMRDLTDLQYETIAIDPHLSSTIGKRFRGVAAMAPQVIQATGDGIDERLAQLCAEMVRQQIAYIPGLRQSILQLNWGHCLGRAALEKVWVENPYGSNVRWRIERLHWIHPRRLALGPERELRVRDDLFDGLPFSPRGVELREYPFKFISFTPQLFNDYPEREGFGPRALYWSFFKRFSWRERLVLLEVFGKPWRIVYTDVVNGGPQKADLEEAAEFIDGMGANATGVVPPGAKVDTQHPGEKATENHRGTAYDADDQISKLILGQTRTTDAKPSALGSAGDEVAQDEQDEIKWSDGQNLSDVLTEQLAVDIVALNIGPDAIDHAPRIELRYEPKRNPQQETERARTLIVDMGVALKRDELYERVGFTMPAPGDDVVEGRAQPAGGLPGLPGLEGLLPGIGGPDANPLGEGGTTGPDSGSSLRQQPDDLALLRAARVLALLDLHRSRR